MYTASYMRWVGIFSTEICQMHYYYYYFLIGKNLFCGCLLLCIKAKLRVELV